MGTHYSQLTLNERYQIQALHELKYSARAIARELGRSNKTVSEELRRLGNKHYCAVQADNEARQKRKLADKAQRFDAWHQEQLDALLTLNYSPEQIAGRIRLEVPDKAISCSTCYRQLKRLNLYHRLPRKGKPRRKRTGSTAGAALIPGRVDIDERPAIVDEKTEIGHWEGDTVYGQDSYLVTLVERVSKMLLVARVPDKRKETVTAAVNELLTPYSGLCETITFDNGGEFAGHQDIAKALGCSVYFAKPYHSWQRGLNENTNGLLRRYFPKGMALGKLPEEEIDRAQFLINMRPRKALNYQTPLEYLADVGVSLMLRI